MSTPNELDADVATMSTAQLRDEVRRLRAGIRRHRDGSGHDLCWYHPALWGLLPETGEAGIEVPEWPVFLRGCVAFRQSLDEQLADRPRSSEEFDPGRS